MASDIWSFLYNPSAANEQNSSGGSTINAMPDWYVDYTKNLLAGAQAATAEPYQPYDNPRIAELTPDQQAAIDNTRGNVGAWRPGAATAGSLVQQGATASTAGGMTPAISTAMGALNPALHANTSGLAQPYLDAAGGALTGPEMQQSTNTLNTLSQQTLPGGVAGYMSPYTQNVTDRIAELGGRNLNENLLPQVNSTFTGAGQFGSTRNADFTNRALRDTQDSVLGAQTGALQTGFQNASQNYLADNTLRASTATAAGNLIGSNATKLVGVGDTTAAIGSRDFSSQNQGAATLGQLAQTHATAWGADAQRAIQGGQAVGALTQQAQQLGANDTTALEHAGAQQQIQDQSSLDLAYQDYLQQLNQPKSNLQFMNSIIQGMPVSTSTVYDQNAAKTATAASSLSPLGQFLQTVGASSSVGKALGI